MCMKVAARSAPCKSLTRLLLVAAVFFRWVLTKCIRNYNIIQHFVQYNITVQQQEHRQSKMATFTFVGCGFPAVSSAMVRTCEHTPIDSLINCWLACFGVGLSTATSLSATLLTASRVGAAYCPPVLCGWGQREVFYPLGISFRIYLRYPEKKLRRSLLDSIIFHPILSRPTDPIPPKPTYS